VELLVVDAVRALHLAVEASVSRLDVDVPDAPVEDVPVKRRLELSSIVGLDDLHQEAKPLDHVTLAATSAHRGESCFWWPPVTRLRSSWAKGGSRTAHSVASSNGW
jgi:hypothetical protein